MKLHQSFVLALKALSTSKMRALLTMLGIIIGVAAVIVIISLGTGMQNMISAEFDKMGSNLLQVMVMGRGSSRSVSPEDMFELVEENPAYLAAVSPSVNVSATLKAGSETYSPSIMGVAEDYHSIRNLTVAEGRFLRYIDIARLQHVCVIGSYINQEAFGGDGYGKTLRLNGYEYLVVGVLEEKAESAAGSDDDYVYIPYTNATRINGNSRVSSYVFSATNENTNTQAKALIEARLLKTFGSDDYYRVMSMAEMMTMMESITGTVMTVLAAIAAISLLVGGIGIMNIMLVSVTERTREIGIRKSLGAKQRDIRGQFIVEAGTTSCIGGILGILVGVALAGVAGNLVDVTAAPSPGAILIAVGVSVAIGVFFGYLPANKAAKLNPIDALRYE